MGQQKFTEREREGKVLRIVLSCHSFNLSVPPEVITRADNWMRQHVDDPSSFWLLANLVKLAPADDHLALANKMIENQTEEARGSRLHSLIRGPLKEHFMERAISWANENRQDPRSYSIKMEWIKYDDNAFQQYLAEARENHKQLDIGQVWRILIAQDLDETITQVRELILRPTLTHRFGNSYRHELSEILVALLKKCPRNLEVQQLAKHWLDNEVTCFHIELDRCKHFTDIEEALAEAAKQK